MDEKDYRWIFHLDDNSGSSIEVTCPKERSPLPVPTSGAPSAPSMNEEIQRNRFMGRTLSGNAIDLKDIDLGCVLKVKGGISEFRGEKQVTLERFGRFPSRSTWLHKNYHASLLLTSPSELIRSTTSEAAAWREMHGFRTSILCKPWHILPDEETRLKAEADGTKAQAKEKARRKAERKAKELKREAQKEEKERRRKKHAEREALRPGGASKRRTSDKENLAR